MMMFIIIILHSLMFSKVFCSSLEALHQILHSVGSFSLPHLDIKQSSQYIPLLYTR